MANFTTSEKEYMQAPKSHLIAGRIVDEEPLAVVRDDRLRVGVFAMTERREDNGVPLRLVHVEFLSDDEWIPIFGLDERNLPTMMAVFEQVRQFLDEE